MEVGAASRASARSGGAFETIDWALVAAAHGGHTACLALLLRCPGASVCAQNGDGLSLLQLTAQCRHYGCLQLLIDAGAAIAVIAGESEGGEFILFTVTLCESCSHFDLLPYIFI